MNVGIATGLYLLLFQILLIIKVQAKEQCSVRSSSNATATIICRDECCSTMATSFDTACCSSISWSSLAIPFFIVAAVCFLAVCFVYCRPLWKLFLCGHKCPCSNRTQVRSANTTGPSDYPVHIINNEGLPDYETIVKDSATKDMTPPPYNFVTSNPNDFGITARVPSAPPQYISRPNSAAVIYPSTPDDS